MFKNKKQTIKIIATLIFGVLFLSNIYGIIGTTSYESINEVGLDTETILDTEIPIDDDDAPIFDNIVDPIDFRGEEVIEPSNYDRNAIEWRPIEETLKNMRFNAEADGGSIATASYDALTGTETITTPIFEPTPENAAEISTVEPYAGLLASTETSESVIGTDGRTVYNNLGFPGSSIVKLYITDAWGRTWYGSGAIIDAYHVLTAGHCAYIRDDDFSLYGWASSIEIVPGMDTSDTPSDPYGSAWMTYMRSYTGWTVSGSSEHDWAVLTLDRNVGSFTGWMGRQWAGSTSSIYSGTMNVAGYPMDLSGGNRMYWDADSGAGATTNNHYYWADTAGGMSGGPVWRFDGSSRYILTVHAYGRDGLYSNFGTRLNNDKYDRIFTWLGADSAPTDKADLIDRGSAYDSVTGGTWTATTTIVTLTNDIRNVGTASSGIYYVHYYASTNDYISTSDYYIGTSTSESTGAFATDTATFTGTLPDIPAGVYYIGWIIDKDDTVDEFDEGNNKAVFATQRTILGAPPPSGYIEVTVRDSTTNNLIPSAYVTVKDDTDTIIDTGYTDGSGFYVVTELDIGWHTVEISKSGYYDQQKTDYINWDGDDDYLTFYMVEMPPDSGYIEVNVKDYDTSNPLISAYVQTVNISSGLVINSGYTDGSGFYNITGLYIGWYEVSVSKSGYKDHSKQNYINWNGDDDYLTFYLEEMPINSGYIEVRTYNETGGPLAGVLVKAWNNSGATLVGSGYTDATGLYNITGLVIGWYEVNVTYLGWQEQSKSNYINWNGDDDYLSFWMVPNPPDSGYIEVNVKDSVTSSAISNALVTVTNQSSGLVIQTGYTDPSGFYKVVNLTIGWYTIEVTREGYHAQSKQEYINWAGDDDYLTFYIVELPPDSGYIEVLVKDDNTLAPIQNALVTCYYSNGTYFSSGYTDASGFYNITGLYIGLYEIEVSHIDYGGISKTEFINWNGDDDYLSFFLVVNPPGWIEVNVFNGLSYNPIENAFVRCFNTTSGELFDSGYTNGSGFYNITGLLVGMWTVNVTYPGFKELSKFDYINWRGDDDYLTFYLEWDTLIIGPVAIFQDQIPWGFNVTEPLLVDYNIPYIIYQSSDFGVDISSYQKVIISPAQTQTFYDRLNGNVSWLEDFAFNGGILQFSACDWTPGKWNTTYLLPGGVNKTFTGPTTFTENVTINLPMHPVLHSPFPVEDNELDNWFYSAHSTFTTYPANTQEILLDGNTLDPVLIQLAFGAGSIIMSTQPLEWNHQYNKSRLHVNLLLYNPLLAFDTITVTSPQSSSSWVVLTSQLITWESTGTISNVKIDLFENGVFISEIEASTPNDGSYSWSLPIGLSNSTIYQIRVSDAAYTLTNDNSENFEIQDTRSITITSPITGDHWLMLNDYDITWISTGTIATVMIELYASSILILEIAASTPNDGAFTWSIPDTLINYTEYVIRVSDSSDPTLFDDSDLFTITGESSGGIPGFDLLISIGLLVGVSLTILRRKRKKLSIHKS
ncbi:MAG: carboxypeptidase regulatory-like domain-containing protein [Candidatus Lokiarchaeota archaeon]|nr:carboxypeptidase regulatory-like domain-containing protein [Candidatus Lokiarchaeota archaeon]